MTEARHERPRTVRCHLYEASKTGKPTETESRLVVAGGRGEGGGRDSPGDGSLSAGRKRSRTRQTEVVAAQTHIC